MMLEHALGLLNCTTSTSTILSTSIYMATEVKTKLTDLEHCTNHMWWPLVSLLDSLDSTVTVKFMTAINESRNM